MGLSDDLAIAQSPSRCQRLRGVVAVEVLLVVELCQVHWVSVFLLLKETLLADIGHRRPKYGKELAKFSNRRGARDNDLSAVAVAIRENAQHCAIVGGIDVLLPWLIEDQQSGMATPGLPMHSNRVEVGNFDPDYVAGADVGIHVKSRSGRA